MPFRARIGSLVAAAFLLACGKAAQAPSDAKEVHFSGSAAVRVSWGRAGESLLLLETLQPQALVTTPMRSAAMVGADGGLLRRYDAPAGWLLIDAVAHSSGEVSLLSLRVDGADYPMRAMVSRVRTDGVIADHELLRLLPPNSTEPPPALISSLDRARIVAYGEDLFAVVRWANNSVQAYRLVGANLNEKWAAWVEPAAALYPLGIIGGGFDNFHQGDVSSFVYADVDAAGNLYACVASTQEVLASHDPFFGDDLTSQADPASFDFGAAVVTRIAAEGVRSFARLMGFPARNKRLLNMKVAGDSVILLGRVKTGDQPGSWDGWILSSRGETGQPVYERNIDVQNGDMFWDIAPLSAGRLLAVGSTNYTQNPAGLSVSDSRDGLALVLAADGSVERRIALPAGPAGRGNEAMSASAGDRNQIAISGVENAPGTHAEVYSDAFLVLRPLDAL